MTIILLILGALLLVGFLAMGAGLWRDRKLKRQLDRGEISELPSIKNIQDMECCGQHETCEKDSLLAAVSKQIEYYDDEELDSYQGVASSDYDNEAEELFREILYTMQETDVAGWVRSLQLRGIELPDALKDEVFLIIGERRQ